MAKGDKKREVGWCRATRTDGGEKETKRKAKSERAILNGVVWFPNKRQYVFSSLSHTKHNLSLTSTRPPSHSRRRIESLYSVSWHWLRRQPHHGRSSSSTSSS
mmetsp:Transcript_37233/g.119457  ORF Transcript_37233/g.119457 Transcript_37233/m.119457 type:complete len:103 (+) Transcript_37233:114-422(+)